MPLRGELLVQHEPSPLTQQVFNFLLNRFRQRSPEHPLLVNGREVPLMLVRNPRARRYVLRLRPDGTARVTIPRGGSMAEARRFAERNTDWLQGQFQRLTAHPRRPKEWLVGMKILFRGEPVQIEDASRHGQSLVQFGNEVIQVANPAADLRPAVEKHLRKMAALELPPRVVQLAALHGIEVRRITVRNQRSRWGSCSRRRTISLNWRLIQAPEFVRDYICLHELVHLREMNHSARFWREVARVCPDYELAERWLKQHSFLLRDST